MPKMVGLHASNVARYMPHYLQRHCFMQTSYRGTCGLCVCGPGMSLKLKPEIPTSRPVPQSAMERSRSLQTLPEAARVARRALGVSASAPKLQAGSAAANGHTRSVGAVLAEETPLGRLYAVRDDDSNA